MVFYSPVRNDDRLEYEFKGKEITCFYNGELFGVYNVDDLIGYDPNFKDEFMPIRSVWVDEQGVYWVTVLNYYGFDAPEEVRFPDWVEV